MKSKRKVHESIAKNSTAEKRDPIEYLIEVEESGEQVVMLIPGGWGRRRARCAHSPWLCCGWTRPRRWADTRQRETANAEDDAGGECFPDFSARTNRGDLSGTRRAEKSGKQIPLLRTNLKKAFFKFEPI